MMRLVKMMIKDDWIDDGLDHGELYVDDLEMSLFHYYDELS